MEGWIQNGWMEKNVYERMGKMYMKRMGKNVYETNKNE